MLKTFKVYYVLSNSNYLIEINLCNNLIFNLILLVKIPHRICKDLRSRRKIKVKYGVHVLVGI